MTTDQQISALKAELEIKEKNYSVSQNWLIRNFSSPDRSKIISDLNATSVEIATVKYKIENLEKGLPLLGHEIPNEIQITEQNRKQI